MEPTKRYREEILRRVEELPEEQLAKVVSLLNKLDAETPKAPTYSDAIKNVWGLLSDGQSSSVSFAAQKTAEKGLDK